MIDISTHKEIQHVIDSMLMQLRAIDNNLYTAYFTDGSVSDSEAKRILQSLAGMNRRLAHIQRRITLSGKK